MTSPPVADQQPITAADPRVQQILAMIQAKQSPVAPDPSGPQPAQIAPIAAPQAPPAPNVALPNGPQLPNLPPMQGGQAQIAPPPAPDVTQAKPGPVKSFLQHLVSGLGTDIYAGSQGALQKLGLPTDYEKQQNALKIGLQQQQQDSLEGLRKSQSDLYSGKLDQLQSQLTPTQIPNDPKYGAFAGTTLPLSAASAVMQKMEGLQNAKDIAAGKVAGAQGVADTKAENTLALEQLKQAGGNPRDHVMRSVNGQIGLYNKRDGSLVKSLGADTSTLTPVIRARANAAYRPVNVMDSEGNPTAVSALDQLRTGAPAMTANATQTLAGDKLGAVTYLGANARVEKNLPVLMDSTQRGIIARTTEDVERNPGAFDSIVNSALQDGLSPEGADLIAAMKQMNEFGSTFKKYTGNGGSSTDSLRATIHSNQPSTANSIAVNQKLLQQDRALATGVLTNLSRPGKYTVPSKGTAPSPSGSHPFFSQFGGATK